MSHGWCLAPATCAARSPARDQRDGSRPDAGHRHRLEAPDCAAHRRVDAAPAHGECADPGRRVRRVGPAVGAGRGRMGFPRDDVPRPLPRGVTRGPGPARPGSGARNGRGGPRRCRLHGPRQLAVSDQEPVAAEPAHPHRIEDAEQKPQRSSLLAAEHPDDHPHCHRRDEKHQRREYPVPEQPGGEPAGWHHEAGARRGPQTDDDLPGEQVPVHGEADMLPNPRAPGDSLAQAITGDERLLQRLLADADRGNTIRCLVQNVRRRTSVPPSMYRTSRVVTPPPTGLSSSFSSPHIVGMRASSQPMRKTGSRSVIAGSAAREMMTSTPRRRRLPGVEVPSARPERATPLDPSRVELRNGFETDAEPGRSAGKA